MRHTFDSPLGVFGLEANEQAVTRLFFPEFVPDDFNADGISSPVLDTAEREIRAYLAGEAKAFTVPLEPGGDGFMLEVWRQLCAIGFGELMTYGEVARAVGSPGASRAVGLACKHNPIPILIPCHRVVGAGGKLTGFSGGGLGMKRRLIDLEAGGLFKGIC